MGQHDSDRSRIERSNTSYSPTRRSVSGARRAVRSTGSGLPAAETKAKTPFPIIPVVVAVVVALIAIILAVTTCSGSAGSASSEGDASEAGSTESTSARVSFVAVGDNLPEDILGSYAYSQGGDHYDYTSIYENIKPYIEAADFAYVKEEVHLDDELGVHGYPSFNAPESLADDLISVGFDIIGSASNHIYDWGYFGACARNREVWNSKDVVFAGTNLNEEEANTIATFEKDGITFAFLDYTYGVNGYSESDLEWYEVNFMSEDRITSDVNKAHEIADVVIVAMHWGTENYTAADDTQLQYAQLLADLDVDLVLGSHPHVIGPVDWVQSSTSDHQTLVCYSLGNFLSHHDYPDGDNELEGMVSCDFVRDTDGSIHIENATWTPLVNHTDDSSGTYRIYALKDYSNELAANATALSSYDDAVGWLREEDRSIVGDAITIDDGQEDADVSSEESETAASSSAA